MATTQSAETVVYQRPESLTTIHTHYCPGCTHGVAHRLIAEVLDEMGIREETIGVAPVGCSVFAYKYFNCDFAEAAHGRAPAMATGIKRVRETATWRPLEPPKSFMLQHAARTSPPSSSTMLSMG